MALQPATTKGASSSYAQMSSHSTDAGCCSSGAPSLALLPPPHRPPYSNLGKAQLAQDLMIASNVLLAFYLDGCELFRLLGLTGLIGAMLPSPPPLARGPRVHHNCTHGVTSCTQSFLLTGLLMCRPHVPFGACHVHIICPHSSLNCGLLHILRAPGCIHPC